MKTKGFVFLKIKIYVLVNSFRFIWIPDESTAIINILGWKCEVVEDHLMMIRAGNNPHSIVDRA